MLSEEVRIDKLVNQILEGLDATEAMNRLGTINGSCAGFDKLRDKLRQKNASRDLIISIMNARNIWWDKTIPGFKKG